MDLIGSKGFKMGIPTKALQENQLLIRTDGSADIDGSHQTYRAEVIIDGAKRIGFYKKLDNNNHYPELLAKISVATSLFKQLFQGTRSAEERLVFKGDKIVGTLSLAIEKFQSFNYTGEVVPVDPQERERVIPSLATLVEHNIMEVLFGRFVYDDDDTHPHNIGLKGDFDFDMFFYWFTIFMKEPRPVVGVPKKRPFISIHDWEQFPNIQDSLAFYWPTYPPGKQTLPSLMPEVAQKFCKSYPNMASFSNLAGNPDAQKQKFNAAMKYLLTNQPAMIKKRLHDLFGDMPLNYTSLDEMDPRVRAQYEKEFPDLCNAKTNTGSFVDFMMLMYQKHYDNLYRVVVLYEGCATNGYRLSLDSTADTLYYKPSIYKNIKKWMLEEQNQGLYAKDEPEARFNEKELEQRYHQIYRDANAPVAKDLLHRSFRLTDALLNKASVTEGKGTTNNLQGSLSTHWEISAGKEISDEKLTSIWDYMGSFPTLSWGEIEPKITVDPGKVEASVKLMVEFTNQLHVITKAYYSKSSAALTEEDNKVFVKSLRSLDENYRKSISKSLSYTTEEGNEFLRIASRLNQFITQNDFEDHLDSRDEPMEELRNALSKKANLPLSHEATQRSFNESLFLWAKDLSKDEFNDYISEIIIQKYNPMVAVLSTRQRGPLVMEYLKNSMQDANDTRLAYILTNSTDESGGALNTCLIAGLTPKMIQKYPISSIRAALEDNSFINHTLMFTKSAITYAQSKGIVKLADPAGISLFYKTIYEWVSTIPASVFAGIINAAVNDYKQGKWLFWNSREAEVQGYLSDQRYAGNNAKILGLIFNNAQDTSSLNEKILQRIVNQIQSSIAKDPAKLELPGYRLFTQFNTTEHLPLLRKEAVKHSCEPANMQIKEKAAYSSTANTMS